ncbi:MAG: hypothetical protein AAB786_00920 [Patescibacteria group bacterium]
MNTSINIDKKIEKLVTNTVRRVFLSEFTKFRNLVLPYVSLREQRDIEARYGKKPSRKTVRSFSFEI